MKTISVRFPKDDDTLYRAVFEAAHDNRVSLNTYVIDTLREKVEK